ncbi:uncharacterized protein F4812DRAFT_283167 [Daldinia caldariorum]|uniref:uncharacterized protein n=1 Tax=Daldinia caldariorum TaxID=326644 RepID=UPI0020073ADD|nr:uncharacterized protein F4812DRAFT_283167 [Daldinia caldariorum]KAI1470944.1 hypothetical protein F4812DRAFT_283167 [Daldinia caldariorum]
MKFVTVFFLLSLPGVARTSLLYARQDGPSGNFSVALPLPSPSSQTEPSAPSLVATSLSTTKKERGLRGPDGIGPQGPPPEPAPGSPTSPVELPPLAEDTAQPAATSTIVDVETVRSTTTLILDLPTTPTTVALPDTSSAQFTTIVTTNSQSAELSSPTTFLTSKSAPSVTSPTLSEDSKITAIAPNSNTVSSTTGAVTMSSSTPAPSDASSNDSGSGTSTSTIVLSTVLSIAGVVLIAVAAYLCTGDRRRRLPMFNRGITPIGDDEIATWKSNRSAEKANRYTTRPTHSQNGSTSTSTRGAPSLIQYQNGARPSLEVVSPRSFLGDKNSFDLPQIPGAVLARAPNARSGLTDETVPGDDPFLPSPRRHPSRLHKLPSNSSSPNIRKGSRSDSLRSFSEPSWRDSAVETSSLRGSSDGYARSHRIYSNSPLPPPPRLSFGENEQFTGLSPPPSRRGENTIGLAVG